MASLTGVVDIRPKLGDGKLGPWKKMDFMTKAGGDMKQALELAINYAQRRYPDERLLAGINRSTQGSAPGERIAGSRSELA